jgi:hypothetical protein
MQQWNAMSSLWNPEINYILWGDFSSIIVLISLEITWHLCKPHNETLHWKWLNPNNIKVEKRVRRLITDRSINGLPKKIGTSCHRRGKKYINLLCIDVSSKKTLCINHSVDTCQRNASVLIPILLVAFPMTDGYMLILIIWNWQRMINQLANGQLSP